MRKLFLATASALALGLATSGASFAAQPGNSAQAPATSSPSATMPSTNGQYGTTGQAETTSPSEQGMQATAPEHLSQNQLKQVQQKLKDEGLYKGEIDGQMGPNTKQAIEQFQQKNNLEQTGRLDQQTLAAMDVNLNGMNGTVGEGSSTLPSNQPANAGALNNESGSSSASSATTPSTAGQSEATSPSEQGMQATAPEHLSQNQLKQVQQKLQQEGLYKGEIDGQMGPNTKQAIEQFQQKNNLQQTGQLDQQTLSALNISPNGMNGNNGAVGEGSSATPGNQPATAGEPSSETGSTGTQSGTTGMSGSQTGTSTNGGPSAPATQR